MGCFILGIASFAAIECAMGNPHRPKKFMDDDYEDA
jgi:hypothetical protein